MATAQKSSVYVFGSSAETGIHDAYEPGESVTVQKRGVWALRGGGGEDGFAGSGGGGVIRS